MGGSWKIKRRGIFVIIKKPGAFFLSNAGAFFIYKNEPSSGGLVAAHSATLQAYQNPRVEIAKKIIPEIPLSFARGIAPSPPRMHASWVAKLAQREREANVFRAGLLLRADSFTQPSPQPPPPAPPLGIGGHPPSLYIYIYKTHVRISLLILGIWSSEDTSLEYPRLGGRVCCPPPSPWA